MYTYSKCYKELNEKKKKKKKKEKEKEKEKEKKRKEKKRAPAYTWQPQLINSNQERHAARSF